MINIERTLSIIKPDAVERNLQQEIKNMRGELFKTRKQLRDVQHNLNRDIERLESKLKFINVGLMPLAVAVIAIVLATIGMQRRRKSGTRN